MIFFWKIFQKNQYKKQRKILYFDIFQIFGDFGGF